MAASFPKTQEFLQKYLANLEILYQKLRSFHWNVEGRSFFTLHAQLEKLYDSTAEFIDEVAERLLMIGTRPLSTYKDYLEHATLQEAPAQAYPGPQVAQTLLADYSQLIESARQGISISEQEGDTGTMDMLTQNLRAFEKLSWMLSAYLKD